MRKKIFMPLRELRKSCRITTEEMATRLGVTKQAISRWELGQTYPELHYLPKIAAMFNVSIDFLLSYKPEIVKIANEDEELFKSKYFWKPSVNLILNSVLNQIPPTKPLRVLEMACDDGYCALVLARLGYIVTAFDNSAIKIERARQLAKLIRVKIELTQDNLLDYDFVGRFDVIYSLNGLNGVAIRDRAALFEKIKSHTNENGLNIFETVASKNFEQSLFQKNEYLWKSGELFGFYTDWKYEVMEEQIIAGGDYKNFMVSRKI
ncbi:MAG: helix-turn-helix domain-containing protein [Selenomonadaceae bacterium]|nr:helix-turn-helix domain-containing protein [Selenomonadaceae bacterium]